VATNTTATWQEVGIINLTPSVADGNYLGAGNVTGTTSGAVGRFTPHHFTVAVTQACSGSFTYAGQPFGVAVTAFSGLGTPSKTANYDGTGSLGHSFAKALTLSDAGATGLGSLAGASVAASSFVLGQASSITPSYSLANKQTAPTGLVLRATDADGISSASHAEGTALLRSGRLVLSNAFGRASTPLELPLRAQYWGGQAWVHNSADSCTSLSAANVALSNPRNALGAPSAATTSVAISPFAGGNSTMTLSAPNPAGHSLSIDLALNLGSSATDQSCLPVLPPRPASTGAAKPWLRSRHGSCAPTADRDPAGRATFGIYTPETRKTVHLRDMY